DYVAVDIGATWCGPCREYSPTFHKVAEEYKGKVVFCQVVLDQIDKKEERTISKDYKVRYIPKTMLFKKGKEVYSRAGDIEKEDLKSLLDEYLLDKKSDSKN
ncbi:hypothetical protein FJZ53_00545, partial [Candidatus Woesearchaeota archaeon]|nr:hypothetical protein [Candidatus Woesearchaeota archaeon]